jgi:hypothetical protein
MIAVILWFLRIDRVVKKQRHHLRQSKPVQEEESYENKKNIFEPGGRLHHILKKEDPEKKNPEEK